MSTSNRPPGAVDVNSFASIATIVALAAVAPAVLLTAPVLVGGMVEQLGFTPPQAGYVISIELWFMSLATLPALYWMPRVNWRHACYVALVLMLLGNLASTYATTYQSLLLLRAITALANGTIMVTLLVTIGMTRNQDSVFGWWVVGQLVVGAVGLKVLPYLLPDFGLRIFFIGIALMTVPLFALIQFLPTRGIAAPASSASSSAVKLLPSLLGLGSIFLFYLALGGVWTYVERMGDAAGIDSLIVGDALFISSLIGVAGAVTASFTGGKSGRLFPVLVGFAMLLGSLLLLSGTLGVTLFYLATGLFKYGWTFVLPYLLACITSYDPSGRLIVITNLVIGSGLALGPSIAAFYLGEDLDYGIVTNQGLVFTVVALLLILPLATRKRIATPVAAEA